MAQSWNQFSLASIRKQCPRSESNKPSETTCGGFTMHRPTYVSTMSRHKRWLGMWSKWLNLNSAFGYHITPLSPIFLFILDSSSALPCFCLLISVLRFTSYLCFSCHGLLLLGSFFGLALGIRWLHVTHLFSRFPSLPHSEPMHFCSQLNPLELLALARSPALSRQLFTLGLTLMFP